MIISDSGGTAFEPAVDAADVSSASPLGVAERGSEQRPSGPEYICVG